ncbi:MAG TPA: RsmG family class I SAM-dependent methyltransferase [Candidatus Limnocylindrales bacterium]|nr:RsmG family class I SAM-dependent methyltransferase [Candidatus Limnocylindrales bacterium]
MREPAAIAVRHVVDSLTAWPILVERQIPALLDLGSGGGFPGIPLAVAASLERAVLADSIGKKAAFLGVAVEAIGIASRVGVAAARAEELARDTGHRERWPAVTARAVGALADLVELAFPLLLVGGSLIAWKRGDLDEEVTHARRALVALGGGSIELRDTALRGLDDHRLVVVTKRRRTPVEFPRDPALRRRRPW